MYPYPWAIFYISNIYHCPLPCVPPMEITFQKRSKMCQICTRPKNQLLTPLSTSEYMAYGTPHVNTMCSPRPSTNLSNFSLIGHLL